MGGARSPPPLFISTALTLPPQLSLRSLSLSSFTCGREAPRARAFPTSSLCRSAAGLIIA
eukprot:scaffold27311_cov31-Tisochrysis_lutea.AAC.1